MPSAFSPNKNLELPASGSYANAWAGPVNADWTLIDTCFGGHASISVTGIGAGTYSLSLAQFQPPNLAFTGILSANLVYALPASIGGLWSVSNATTGAFTLTFAVSGGGSFVLPQGARSLLICDGTNVALAQSAFAVAFSQLLGSIANGQVPQSAVTQFQGVLAIAMSQVSGIIPQVQLPSTSYHSTAGSALITIQSGGAPSGGSSGDLFLIY